MEKYLTPEQVCEIVPGLTVKGLSQMRFRGDGPPYIKPSPKKVIYAESSVHAWLQSNERTSTRASA